MRSRVRWPSSNSMTLQASCSNALIDRLGDAGRAERERRRRSARTSEYGHISAGIGGGGGGASTGCRHNSGRSADTTTVSMATSAARSLFFGIEILPTPAPGRSKCMNMCISELHSTSAFSTTKSITCILVAWQWPAGKQSAQAEHCKKVAVARIGLLESLALKKMTLRCSIMSADVLQIGADVMMASYRHAVLSLASTPPCKFVGRIMRISAEKPVCAHIPQNTCLCPRPTEMRQQATETTRAVELYTVRRRARLPGGPFFSLLFSTTRGA